MQASLCAQICIIHAKKEHQEKIWENPIISVVISMFPL